MYKKIQFLRIYGNERNLQKLTNIIIHNINECLWIVFLWEAILTDEELL